MDHSRNLDPALWIIGGAVLCLIALTTAALSASFGWIEWSSTLLWMGIAIYLSLIILVACRALSDFP